MGTYLTSAASSRTSRQEHRQDPRHIYYQWAAMATASVYNADSYATKTDKEKDADATMTHKEKDAYATMTRKEKAKAVEKLKKEVRALKQEATLERMPTSQTIKELFAYIQEHEKDDPLLQNKNSSCIDPCNIV